MAVIEKRVSAEEFDCLCANVARAAQAAYLKDGQLAYRAASATYAALCGVRQEDLIGSRDEVAGGDVDARERDEAERRTLVFGRAQRVRLKDGAGGGVLMELLRIRRSDDKATFVLALDPALDVDNLLTAPEAVPADPKPFMADPDSDLQSAIEAMPMGVVLTDRDLTVELVNGPFFDIWKVIRREDLVGRNFRALIDVNRHNNIYDVPDEEWESYVASRLEEIAAGRVEPRVFARADGVTLMYSVTPLSGDRRMICYYDITEMQENRRQIDESKKRLVATVRLLDDAAEAMAQGLLIYDDSEIVFVNERFYEFLGVPRERIARGKPWWNLIEYCAARGDYGSSPEEVEKAIAYIRESAKNKLFHQMERRGANGRWLRIDGKPTAGGLTVVTYSDISELKERESELKELVVKAEASDRAKSEFLANMSHEIRTPMNGVLGMAELLSKTELDTRQRTYCDIIVKSGNALLTIINDILDFSKIEAGAITLDRAPFDLRDAVEDVASLMAKNATEKDIELAVDIQPDLPTNVLGDTGRFRQVLTNLVGNAVKFTEKGHVLLSVSGAVDGEMLSLRIDVEDTGLGIPAEKLATIFDKFSQVDGSSTRRHEGTGLGLAITAKLIEMMGGSVAVKSEEGIGSVFSISIALPVEAEAMPARRAARDIAGARILIVDDNAVNRDILTTQLTARGCDVCAAIDAREGLAFLKAASEMGIGIDCMILDHHMPRMTGLEMAAAVRRTPVIADLPIILLTSVDVDPHTAEIVELELAAWLTKPAREALLLETIERVAAGGTARMEQGANAPVEMPAADRPGTREDDGDDGLLLDLWMDDEALAESVSSIGAALSSDDPDEESAHLDRQMDSRPQSAGRALPAVDVELDVLVAEDNEVNQIVFSQILDDLDVVYRIVGNGALALEAWKKDRPRLILMDVSMPVMNGHQAAQAIREAEAARGGVHVPIIGVTAHALKGDREACLEAGMDDYMTKPISPEALEKKLAQWLHGAGAADNTSRRGS